MVVCEIPYTLSSEIYSARKLQKKSIATSSPITMSKVIEKAYSLLRLSSLKQR